MLRSCRIFSTHNGKHLEDDCSRAAGKKKRFRVQGSRVSGLRFRVWEYPKRGPSNNAQVH